MKINERLNLVIPLYRFDDDPYAWVHSMPISREIFESHYLLLSKTFTAIHSEGLGEIAGPKVALLMLKDVAKSMTNDPDYLIRPLMNEMRRLSNVILRANDKWETMPLQDAINGKFLDDEDLREVENSLTFFIVVSHLYPKTQKQMFLDGSAKLWGAVMTSLNYTEYKDSLLTSTTIESIGEPTKQLSVPS